MTPNDVEPLLTITKLLDATTVIEIGHGRNLRYMKALTEAGFEVIGMEKDPSSVKAAETEDIPSITADAITDAHTILKTYDPDLVYSVRPPYELALDIVKIYAPKVPVALKPMTGEEGDLPNPDAVEGRWYLYLPRHRSASRT